MVNLIRLEKKLQDKGITNVEVTKKNRDYYVLHICKNGVPVPLIKTQDRKELKQYLEVQYGVKAK
jgi:hypothetical protein